MDWDRERELMKRLRTLELKVTHLYAHAGVAEPVFEEQPGDPAFSPDVRAALDAGNTIGAIKAYRESAGCGLAEAKAAVEGYRANVQL